MGTTRIMILNKRDTAENTAGEYKAYGNNVVLIGPTDVIRTAGSSPSAIEWDSGPTVEWYMVIVTNNPVAGSGMISLP